MQPAKIFSARKLRISLIRLLKQRIPILERDNRVNLRIDTVDVLKKPLHYRSTGNLLCLDRPGQSNGIHCEQLGNINGWHINSWSKAIHSGSGRDSPVTNSAFFKKSRLGKLAVAMSLVFSSDSPKARRRRANSKCR